MKLRTLFVFLACLALLAAGCGGSDGSGGGDAAPKEKKEEKPASKQEKAAAEDRENKEKAVKEARAAYKDADEDVGACRNLAMSYIALASPASTGDPKNPPKVPEDREESMEKAIDTLEKCRDLDPKDRDVQQMLASSYMGTSDYEKASTLLEQLAKSSKGQERANAYYAWGLAASNAQQIDKAIGAWQRFLELAPPKDPRIAQIRQSIKALQAAKNQPKPAETAPAEPADAGADEGDSGEEGSGGGDDT